MASSFWKKIIPAAGAMVGGYFGGPPGAMAGAGLGTAATGGDTRQVVTNTATAGVGAGMASAMTGGGMSAQGYNANAPEAGLYPSMGTTGITTTAPTSTYPASYGETAPNASMQPAQSPVPPQMRTAQYRQDPMTGELRTTLNTPGGTWGPAGGGRMTGGQRMMTTQARPAWMGGGGARPQTPSAGGGRAFGNTAFGRYFTHPYVMGGMTLLDLYSQARQAREGEKATEGYLSSLREAQEAAQWTPEKREGFMKAMQGIFSEQAKSATESAAARSAAAGRGGGAYGRSKERIQRAGHEAAARAMGQTYGPSQVPVGDIRAYLAKGQYAAPYANWLRDVTGTYGQMVGTTYGYNMARGIE